MTLPDLTEYTPADLQALADAVQLRRVELQRDADRNVTALRDATAVDADIAAVIAHADRMQQIIAAPAGASPAQVEQAVKWTAEALYAVGALAVRAARLAAGRTQTAETLPGV